MASSEANPSTSTRTTSPHDTAHHDSINNNGFELSNLDPSTGKAEGSQDAAVSSSSAINPQSAMSQSDAPVASESQAQDSTAVPSTSTAEPAAKSSIAAPAASASSTEPLPSHQTPAELSRFDSVAIGPATDAITAPTTTSEGGPVCHISLLISHTGARHAYKIDEKYLVKRNVPIPEKTPSGQNDPFSISMYTLKELILREWKEEWQAKPTTPHSIRLISFGKLMEDKSSLRDAGFKENSPNVLHIAVKPQDMVDDDEAAKGKTPGAGGTDGGSTPGCRCVIL